MKKFQPIKYIFSIITVFLLIFTIFHNETFAYYDKYQQYKRLGKKILEVNYKEYHNTKNNEFYKKSGEYQELSKITKVDNIFDIASKELEKKVEMKKRALLSKMKENERVITGTKKIDDEIDALDKKGRYLVIEIPGYMVSITDKDYIYIYKHKVSGNVDLITKLKLVFKKFYNNKKDVGRERFKSELLKLLDKYKIKYVEIRDYGIPVDLYIGKNFNKKMKNKTTFFISNGFTTPDLDEYFNKGRKNKKIYIWKYLTDDDIKYDYNIREEQKDGAIILARPALFNDYLYLGMVSDPKPILTTKTLSGNVDLFIYNINKNKFEYLILLFTFIVGVLISIYLTFNFIHNYKSNFKRIPEEL